MASVLGLKLARMPTNGDGDALTILEREIAEYNKNLQTDRCKRRLVC
jgi:hypothetical protein